MSTTHEPSTLPNSLEDPRSFLRQRKSPSKASQLALSQSKVQLPRLIPRDLPYKQSRNQVNIKNVKLHSHAFPLILLDWFHALLRLPMLTSIPLLLSTWTIAILVFAGIYLRIDRVNKNIDCGLSNPGEIIPWSTAFAFSLETCTTVGCKDAFRVYVDFFLSSFKSQFPLEVLIKLFLPCSKMLPHVRYFTWNCQWLF